MDTAAIREIAKTIADEQFLLHWPFYALMIALTALVGFASAFVGAYAKKRGQNYATKADFDSLLAQLRLTTAVAEEVKSQISQADWATREAKTLRRIKLEELLHAIHEVEAWVDADREQRLFNSSRDLGVYPMPKLEVLAGLYFPELAEPVYEFGQLHRKSMVMIVEAQSTLEAAHQVPQERLKILDEFNANWVPMYKSRLKAIAALEKKSREVMSTLVGA
jgi:hypothetical protein